MKKFLLRQKMRIQSNDEGKINIYKVTVNLLEVGQLLFLGKDRYIACQAVCEISVYAYFASRYTNTDETHIRVIRTIS